MNIGNEKEMIGHKLRLLQNQIHNRMEYKKERNERNAGDLTRMQRFTMGFLACNANRDIYQRDIEKRFSISRATASNMLKLMEQKGLIYREAVEHDARLKKIRLTESAERMIRQVEEDIRETEELLVRGLTEEDISRLQKYLDLMLQNVSGVV